MPIYEYRCRKCGDERERITTTLSQPPSCCGEEMTRQVSRPGFRMDHTVIASKGK